MTITNTELVRNIRQVSISTLATILLLLASCFFVSIVAPKLFADLPLNRWSFIARAFYCYSVLAIILTAKEIFFIIKNIKDSSKIAYYKTTTTKFRKYALLILYVTWLFYASLELVNACSVNIGESFISYCPSHSSKEIASPDDLIEQL